MTFPGTQKPTPPTVFNLQASDWVHCEEETGAHAGISRHTDKFVKKKKYKIYKTCLFCQKNTLIEKKSIKFRIYLFFHKEIFQHYVYMY